jgi:NADH:ubiquinone oxidoreductase subunit F (NADH-binding)/Pyruvate/2-oxoacid:ferredoxin oxidoreductase delta subunit/(2Fe-2S) ferredoxin
MNLMKEHLPLLLMAPEPEKGNMVLQRNLAKIRHDYVDKPVIYVGMGTCGVIAGADKTKIAIQEYLKVNQIDADLVDVGCIGLCSEEPIVDIQIHGRTRLSFAKVQPENVNEIIDAVLHNVLPENLVLGQYPKTRLTLWEDVPEIANVDFFREQQRNVYGQCGIIQPESIDEYVANGGYRGFIKALTAYKSQEICEIVLNSGLKGRSGSAYLTGEKWKLALSQNSETRYFICNADESDPGAFVDRNLIEGDPHLIIEGIAIGANAIRASKAYIYIRNDYHLAIRRLNIAIRQAYDYGLLGQNIFNSGFNLDIIIKLGPGAHVCGEETALIASLEGRRGTPSAKPPFPVESGLFGKPTVVNNVETLANIPGIILKGADWFRETGYNNSFGTKLFSVSGKIAKPGIVEIPMGTKLRQILQILGGVPGDHDLKAVHIGGAAGGILNINNLDLPIDYDELENAGLRMGSGSFLVLDNDNCILSLVKYFMRFIQKESCGKCIPCREGSQQMLDIMNRITQKQYDETGHEALERFKGIIQLESLAKLMQETSLCGLGQYAPNTVMTSLKYFRHEFEAHIFDRKCEAGVCKGLKTYIIDVDKCTGCTVCAKKCPADAIIGTARNPFFIVQEKCIGCGACYEHCKFNAISIK